MPIRVPEASDASVHHREASGNRAAWLAALACALAWPAAAAAQTLDAYLPQGVPGFDVQRGVTVLTRLRPDFTSGGVHAGGVLVQAGAGQSVGWDNDVTGQSGGPSSVYARTDASLSGAADGSWGRVGARAAVGQDVFLSLPSEDRTDYDVAVGASLPLGRGALDLSYAHRLVFYTGNDIGQLRADGPVREDVDAARASDSVDLGGATLTPFADASREVYGPAPVGGLRVPQAFRDRDVLAAGVTGRYGPPGERGLLLVVEGSASSHLERAPGQPDYDQQGALALAGLDYPSGGVWRWQALAGVERRTFSDARFAARTAPVGQLAAIWTPTGMTTLTLDAARTIEDTSFEGSSGRVYTGVRAVLDHEYLRNVLLQARARYQSAVFAQAGGTQTEASLGAGATWLADRHVRVSLTYDVSLLSGGVAASGSGGRVQRHVVALALRWAL